MGAFVVGFATVIGTIVAIIVLIINLRKKNAPVEARKQEKRADIAEIILALIPKIQEAMSEIRYPLFDEYFKDKLDNAKYRQNKIEERIAKHDNLFNALRDAQKKAKIIIGYDNVDKAISILFDKRDEVGNAAKTLVTYARVKTDPDSVANLEKAMLETNVETDGISQTIKNAVKTIDDCLIPIARMEK